MHWKILIIFPYCLKRLLFQVEAHSCVAAHMLYDVEGVKKTPTTEATVLLIDTAGYKFCLLFNRMLPSAFVNYLSNRDVIIDHAVKFYTNWTGIKRQKNDFIPSSPPEVVPNNTP